LVDQINCSPKLSNSGDPEKHRIVPEALYALVSSPKTNFKFVVGSHDDMEEINDLTLRFLMRDVRLMPMARTKSEIDVMRPLVIEWSLLHGYQYSPRLHVEEHGDVRGV
jgi:7-carboxy-7-deazaguanine synthase